MRIKTLIRCVVAGILVGPVVLHGTLTAGEAIQFSSDKTKPVAANENPLTKDRLTPKSKLSATAPVDVAGASMMRSDSRRRLDPKEERRLDNKKLEDENWMILDEGDLQAQDEYDEVYGRSDFDSDRKRTSGDIWFGPRQSGNARDSAAQRSRNGGLHAPAQNRPQNSGSRDDEKDTTFNFARRLGAEADAKPERGQSKEASDRSIAGPNSADFGLKALFGPGNNSAPGVDDRNRGRTELGLRSFDAANRQGPSLGGSFGFGRSADSASSMPDSGPKPSASTSLIPSFGSGQLNGGGWSDTFSPRGNPTIGPATPLQTQPQADSSPRSTRGTFDLPSRPGFGR